MKNKKWIVIILCVALAAAAFGIGFSGMFDLTKQTEQKTGTESDRLIGALITEEYLDLFDFDSYFQDNASHIVNGGMIDGQEASQYYERLYATTTPGEHHSEVTFEGVNGISIFCAYIETDGEGYWTSSGDEGYADGHWHLTDTDELQRIEMEGTVYSSTISGWKCFYVNPMYQTADGKIYVVPGSGNSFGGDVTPGMSSSQTLTESKTTVVNGEKKTVEAEIKVTFTFMDPPASITVMQFDKENQAIAQDNYNVDGIPTEISPLKDAQYIIVETVGTASDGSEAIQRQLVQLEDDCAYAFAIREDGICVQRGITINWEK